MGKVAIGKLMFIKCNNGDAWLVGRIQHVRTWCRHRVSARDRAWNGTGSGRGWTGPRVDGTGLNWTGLGWKG